MPKLRNDTDIRKRLVAERSRVKTWRELSEQYDVPMGVLCDLANRGIEPHNYEYRFRLGLPSMNVVYIVGGGNIPEGCQVIGEYKTCACGKRFVPNSPKRYNCFDCQKVRKRKK